MTIVVGNSPVPFEAATIEATTRNYLTSHDMAALAEYYMILEVGLAGRGVFFSTRQVAIAMLALVANDQVCEARFLAQRHEGPRDAILRASIALLNAVWRDEYAGCNQAMQQLNHAVAAEEPVLKMLPSSAYCRYRSPRL